MPQPAPAAVKLLDRDAFNALVTRARGNADVFTRLKYLDSSARRDDSQSQFVITDKKDTIIAAASIQRAPNDPARIWVLGVSVDPAARGKGHATALLRSIFAHAAEKKLVVEGSTFSSDGQAFLAPLMSRIHADYPDVRACTSRYPAELFDGHRPYSIGKDGRAVPVR